MTSGAGFRALFPDHAARTLAERRAGAVRCPAGVPAPSRLLSTGYRICKRRRQRPLWCRRQESRRAAQGIGPGIGPSQDAIGWVGQRRALEWAAGVPRHTGSLTPAATKRAAAAAIGVTNDAQRGTYLTVCLRSGCMAWALTVWGGGLLCSGWREEQLATRLHGAAAASEAAAGLQYVWWRHGDYEGWCRTRSGASLSSGRTNTLAGAGSARRSVTGAAGFLSAAEVGTGSRGGGVGGRCGVDELKCDERSRVPGTVP